MYNLSIFLKSSLLFLVINVSFSKAETICLQCESSINPDCSSRPENISITEMCEKGCMTLIDDHGNTLRKCLSNTEECIEPNCKECYKDKCNSEVFPSDRLKCHQCSGSSCLNLTSLQPELPCSKFVENDSCFTYVIDKNNAVRGCISDENRECIKATDLCRVCSSQDGCNNEPGTHTVTCFDCFSPTDKECQRPKNPPIFSSKCEIDTEISKCSYQELLGRKGMCYTFISENTVLRTCESFEPLNIEDLYNCTGNLCNNECVGDRKCIQCNENDKYCDQKSGLEPIIKNCPEHTVTCHRCEVGNGTFRGCGYVYKYNEETLCTFCSNGDGCYAKKPSRLCYKCNSQTNQLCSELNHHTKDKLVQTCSKPDDYCIAIRTKDDYIIRDCMNEIPNVECSETDPNCMKCNQHYCNTGLIPTNRISCHQCDGASEEDCNKKLYVPKKVCRRYVPNDKCYTYARADKSMVRGCQSDKDINSEHCDKLDQTICAKCNSSGCNNLPYSASPTLSCYKCDADDVECPWSYSGDNSCEKKIQYWEEESCFIYKHENGSVTRGCTLDSDLCSKNDDQGCMKFKGSFSNKQTAVVHSCYICGSNITGEEHCAGNIEKIIPIPCKNEFISYAERGCYKRVQDGQITRGCIADVNKYDLEICKIYGLCFTCFPDNCNESSSKEVSALALLSILSYWMFSHNTVILL